MTDRQQSFGKIKFSVMSVCLQESPSGIPCPQPTWGPPPSTLVPIPIWGTYHMGPTRPVQTCSLWNPLPTMDQFIWDPLHPVLFKPVHFGKRAVGKRTKDLLV